MENKNTERMDKPTEFLLTPEYERTQVNFAKKTVMTELSSDFTLPDYLPEIRKMLGITPRISPISRYLSNNSAEFSGHVDYDLLYLGSDGSLATAPLGTDFSFEVQLAPPENVDFSSSNEVFADTETDMIHVRVTAPRKVSVKNRLRSSVKAFGYDEGSRHIISSAKGCERLTAEPKAAILKRYMSEIAEIRDSIPLSGNGMRPVYCSSNVSINEASLGERRLNCRGELISEIIYENTESGEIASEMRKIPFSQDVGIGEDAPLGYNIRSICGETKLSEAEDSFLLDTDVILEAETLSEISSNLITDLFLPGNTSEVSYREFRYHSAEKASNDTIKLEASFPLTSLSLSDNGEIITCRGAAQTERLNTEGDNCIIEGACKLSVICKNGSELSAGELSVPFTYDTGVKALENQMNLSCWMGSVISRCKIEGENILCQLEIPIAYSLLGEHSIMIADEFGAKKDELPSRQGITVYYPEKGERLWDVAKAYGISLKSIAEANALPSSDGNEPLDSKNYLIIS